MHLFDSDARDEEALCKAEVSIHDLNAVQGYLDRRRHGLSVPTVCEPCKVPAVRWAENHRLNPNPPKDTDGRREDSGRVGEGATGRWWAHWGRLEVGERSSVAA